MKEAKNTNAVLYVQNLREGNEVGGKMKSGELVLNGNIFPFILQKKMWGKLSEKKEDVVCVATYEGKQTFFTKKGYTSLLITCHFQIYAYVKNELVSQVYAVL